MKLKTLCSLLLGATACAGEQGQATPAQATASAPPAATIIKHADPAAAEKLITEKKVVVLDIRTPSEFAAGHLAGATNIDFRAKDFEQKLAGLDRSKPYLVHCASGGRSTSSLGVFKKLGFKEVVHLDGGIRAWQKAAKPVVK